MKKFFITAFAVFLVVLSLVGYVNISFSRLKVTPFYEGCQKVWGHAGYRQEYGANALPGYRKAFDLGATGVELDVRYDTELGRFIVSHDFPYQEKDGKLLKLEDVLQELGGRGYFWLDFKNLKHMGKGEAEKAARRLLALIERHHLDNRVIVESKDPLNLAVLTRAGIPGSYWVNINTRRPGLETRLRVFSFKAMFLYGGFAAFSMDYRDYTPYLRRTFRQVPVHLFTVNSEPEVLELMSNENVKVILSDKNFFKLDSCVDR